MTVLLATFNGEKTLPTTLEACTRLFLPDGGWKLVVVDNGSTDGTSAVLDRFQHALPMTRLHVSERGKNRALNAGIEEREGDLVVFTDDDTVPAPGWLQALRAAADRRPDFEIFGGVIVPRWGRSPERWVLDWVPHDMTYSVTTERGEDGPLPATQVCGPNMAARARLFDLGHRFDVQIGPQAGTQYVMGSETEFTLRMEQLGHKAWFVKDALVEHLVRPFQMERSWVLRRAVRYGRCIYRRDRQRGALHARLLMGMPRWQLRRILAGTASLVGAVVVRDMERAFRASWLLHFDWGYVMEARRSSGKGITP